MYSELISRTVSTCSKLSLTTRRRTSAYFKYLSSAFRKPRELPVGMIVEGPPDFDRTSVISYVCRQTTTDTRFCWPLPIVAAWGRFKLLSYACGENTLLGVLIFGKVRRETRR